MKKIYISLIVVFTTILNSLNSQCSLYPVTLASRINSSAFTLEGKVISKKSFWNSQRNYIYTSNLIAITKVLKGNLIASQIEIITEGGEIGINKQTVEPSLQLKPNEEGLFSINLFEGVPAQFGAATYKVYADAQGFIKYNLNNETADEPFKKYNSINNDLYPELETILGTDLPPFVNPSAGKGYSQSTIASVSGISPLITTAGTSSIITITGTGFGATQGTSTVEFYNADNGGSTYVEPDPSQYISWSNTQIQVMVPTRAGTVAGTAGTGPVRVTVAGSSTLSAQTLTINYGELNLYYGPTTTVYNTRHVDLNGSAGVTWQMYTGFDANASAKASFLRSFQTWRCNTYINWVLGATTTTNVIALDGVNIIRFDIGAELPVGVLGRCTSYFSGCITGTVVNWYVSELDICFDDATTTSITWQFGPTLATGVQYDFESVSLHELGHGHQLSHVINSSDVMHYSLSNSQNKRNLITNNISGGNDVMSRNTSAGVCSKASMAALSPSACGVIAPTASFNVSSPVCVGQSVSLTDLSSDSPSAWNWTMIGGTPASSTLQNTSTSFSTAGVYSISLVATNGFGSSAVLTKTINVVALPTLSAASATICNGTSTLLTVSGASSYTWNPGNLSGASQNLSPVATTIYTIHGSNGTCSSSISSTVSVSATPTVSIANASICAGSSTLMTASGATNYTWNPGGLTGAIQNLSPSGSTAYTLTGSSNSCASTPVIFTITVNTNPTVSVPNASICSGASTLLTATGASSYTWNPGNLSGASQNLSPVSTQIYTVTGNVGSCTSSNTFEINVSTGPTITVANATICAGSSTLITASGASNYTWNPGNLTGASQNLSPSATTIYTVIGLSGTCTQSTTLTVSVTPTPTLSVPNATICSGSSTLLTASGASTYVWNPGGLTGATQNLSPASTSVFTVTGSNNSCAANPITFTINVNSTPTLSVPNATICSGASTLVTASGASSYLWNPGALSGAAQNLNPSSVTVYTVMGTSGSCTSSTNFTITVNATPTINIPNAAICSGNSTLMSASGASTYTWFPGNLNGSSQTLNPGSATVYTVSGSIGSCSSSSTFSINVTTTPTVSATGGSICIGNSIPLNASGASSYTWNPGALIGASQTMSPSSTTIYTVTGNNGNCSHSRTLSVTVFTLPTIFAIVTPTAVCSGVTATLAAGGAMSYTWTNNINSFTIAGPVPLVSPSVSTLYSVAASDGTCISTNTLFLQVNQNPTVNVNSSSNAICSGTSAIFNASGATNYSWNPGALTGATQSVNPTSTTNYTVIGSSNSCSSSPVIVTLTVNPTPTLSVANATICSGTSTLLTVTGANSYFWLPGSQTTATQNINPVSTTIYTIIGTIGPCVSTINSTVSVTPTPTLVVPTAGICSGASTLLTASGATTYTWNPGNLTGASQNLNPSSSSVYTITGSIGNCTSSVNAIISVTTTPTVSVPTGTLCSGNSVSLTASGASSYTWSLGSLVGASQVLSPTVTTVYTIFGSNGICTHAKTATIIVNPLPTVFAIVTPSVICPLMNATLAVGGAPSYTWIAPGPPSFTFAGNNATVNPSTTSVYTVTASDGTCTNTTTVFLQVNPSPTLVVNASTPSLCFGNTATLSATGASNYTWMPSNLTSQNIAVTPSTTSTYSLSGSNSFGCITHTVYTMTVNPNPTISTTAQPATICSGNSVSLIATGAATYSWNPGNVSGNPISVSPTSNTTYTVTGYSAFGCSSSTVVNVSVAPTPTPFVTINPTVVCAGQSSTLTVTGGSSYSWTPISSSSSSVVVTPSVTTLYTATVTTGNCSAIANLTVLVNPSPTISLNGQTVSNICSGDSYTLSASGANNYTWMPGNLSGSNTVVSPLTTTTYTVIGIGSNGCTTNSIKTLSIIPTPTLITTPTQQNFCYNVPATLTASGANNYTWNPGNITNANIIITPTNNITYTLSGQNGTCTSASTLVPINVVSKPSLTVSAPYEVICLGSSITLTSAGASSYTYLPGNSTQNPATFNPTVTTTYTILGASSFNCTSEALFTLSVTICDGLIENSYADLKIFPNPSKDLVQIDFGKKFSGSVTVYNAIGQILVANKLLEQASTQINLEPYSKGIYFVKISSETKSEILVKLVRD